MSDYLESCFSLRGKIAIVTGASRGIGAAVAHALTSAGAHTVGLGRSEEPRAAAASGSEYRCCDILDAGAFASACSNVFDNKGRIDVLVYAAGITLPGADDTEDSPAFRRTLDTNLVAVHSCCRTAAGFMRQTGGW